MTASILVGIVLLVIGFLTSIMGLVSNRWAFTDGVVSILGVLMIFLLVPIWATVFVRQRWPWVPFLAGAVLALGWGDCLLMLIGMFHLIIRGSRRHAIIAAVAGSVVTLGSIVRLCLAPTSLNPFSMFFISPGVQPGNGTLPAPPEDTALAVNVITIIVGVLSRYQPRLRRPAAPHPADEDRRSPR